MLLVVRRTGDAGYDSKNSAESVIDAVDCVRDPTSTPPMPAFAFQNCVEHSPRSELRDHRLQSASVSFFFQRALTKEIFHILFAGERAISLIAELGLVLFLGGLHSPNRDVCSKRAVQPPLHSTA